MAKRKSKGQRARETKSQREAARSKRASGQQPAAERPKPAPAAAPARPSGRTRWRRPKTWELAIVAVVVALVVWAIVGQFAEGASEEDFLMLANRGEAGLDAVVTVPDGGNDHVPNATYNTDYPTTGPHDPNPLPPGFYTDEQPPDRLVHSLEHGIIVIYYDEPGSEVVDRLREWTDLYGGPWSGVLVTKMPGQGEEIVLTAWRRTLRQPTFDPAVAAAFVDLYRGRGPENPVR